MHGKIWGALAATVLVTGCAGTQYRAAAYSDGVVAEAVPHKSFVERHPILASPKHYYEDSGDNYLVKGFAATVVGIPVGIAREGWQIVYGQ